MHGTRLRSRFGLIFSTVAILIAAGQVSAAPEFYGVNGLNLLRFDMGAQTVTVVAPLTSGGGALSFLQDCDFDAAGDLWAVRQGALGFPPIAVNQAYRVNTTDGTSTLQGDFGASAMLQSLAFRTTNSAFYSVNESGGTTSQHLVTANLTAGTVASVAGVAHGLARPRVDALAFAPGGTLFGVWNGGICTPFGCTNDYKLIKFDPLASGVGTVIGTISPGLIFQSLRFDGAGNAYTVEVNTGGVYTVDLLTGQGTLQFTDTDALGTTGLAFIPEPATTMLVGMGVLLAIARRRRR